MRKDFGGRKNLDSKKRKQLGLMTIYGKVEVRKEFVELMKKI